jgi:hypothetical protein
VKTTCTALHAVRAVFEQANTRSSEGGGRRGKKKPVDEAVKKKSGHISPVTWT